MNYLDTFWPQDLVDRHGITWVPNILFHPEVELDAGERFVLAVLCSAVDLPRGETQVIDAASFLARSARLSPKTAKKRLKSLEKKGFLQRLCSTRPYSYSLAPLRAKDDALTSTPDET